MNAIIFYMTYNMDITFLRMNNFVVATLGKKFQLLLIISEHFLLGGGDCLSLDVFLHDLDL